MVRDSSPSRFQHLNRRGWTDYLAKRPNFEISSILADLHRGSQLSRIAVPESRRLDRPFCRAVIPAPESSRVDRPSCKAFIPLPESRIADTTSRKVFIQVPEQRKADGPSRRAFKRRGFLKLSECTQQAIPIPPTSGGHSMAEDNLSVRSRPEPSSGSVIRRIIARLWVISPFRRPRPLGYRPLLRRLRSTQWSLDDLL